MTRATAESWQAVVIGSSAGGTEVVLQVLSTLTREFQLPILLCSHVHASDTGQLVAHLAERLQLTVVEAQDKQSIRPGVLHVAPANYHLLVERTRTLALSTEEKVRSCRPSIDVLFETAGHVYMNALVGVLLSGANDDGADGLRVIRDFGGLTMVQDPATAAHPEMPMAAIERGAAVKVLRPEQIKELVGRLQPGPAVGEVG